MRERDRGRHPRLVLFLGCGKLPNQDGIFLVLEYCDGGNLGDLLYRKGARASTDVASIPLRRQDRSTSVIKRMKRKSKVPSWRTRLRLLVDIAEGMAYLHLCHFCIHVRVRLARCQLSRFVSLSNFFSSSPISLSHHLHITLRRIAYDSET